jgi:hypothetical protein
MPQMLFTDPRMRSPSAAAGLSGGRDENIYSAIVVGHGGAGTQKMFTVPEGQAIPRLVGAGIAPTAQHLLNHTKLTTNLGKAGEVGSAIGELSIRSIGVGFESAYYDVNGALNTYGMGQQEVFEMLSKTFLIFRISGTKQIEGPTSFFPTPGNAFGALATTENSVTVSALSNGWPGGGRRLKVFLPAARTDQLEVEFGTAGGVSVSFSATTGVGQSSLVWCNLWCGVMADVRA